MIENINVTVGIIMGSDSDLPIMIQAKQILDSLNVNSEMTIVSAHRTPKRLYEYAQTAKDRGLKVIIAGAGGAAHLPGMVASLTSLPVIGVPIQTKTLNGLDSLYSIVQMPPGIPVATMAIGGAKNAGLFAARILSLLDQTLQERIEKFILDQEAEVLNKAYNLETSGAIAYLKSLESR
jgi:5-(carboxyamino)imidazole ribonucleotide mutase